MNKLLLAMMFVLTSIFAFSQTYLVDQHFSNVAPSGWSSTSNVWAFNRDETATGHYRNVFDATKYSSRFSSASTGNSIYLYIPINFVSGNTYTIRFYTKRVSSIVVNTNELPNQTTLLSTETKTQSVSSSSAWYEWTFSVVSSYTGAGYFQIWTKTIYGGPTSVYLDDVSILESQPVLPIDLLYFKGYEYNSENILHWSTASEDNNDYFTIEKTKDGIDWRPIVTIEGAGNSTNQLHYSFVDEDVESIINYYRLKQTDYDGKFKYSDIISIDNVNKLKEIDKITNILGQEVDLEYHIGLVIIYYTDGSSQKMIK
jgi:hypothetical protein